MAEEELIDGQYQFVMGIASGNSSQVIEVVEKTSSRHFAMKELKKDAPDFKKNKAQMKREAEIHKTLNHPFIVKFERFSSNRDHTYILMEHFRASNLKIQIKNEFNKVQLQARQLFEGVTSALAYVHQQGYIHRDIKPDNILVNRVGEIRLCDFSLSSKQLKGFGRLIAGKLRVIQGTRTYIAPETIRKQQPTIQTDLYSLGIVFFEALTGRTVFQAPTPEELLQKHLRTESPNPSEFNPNVSPEMDRLIAKMLKKKVQDRPASADEILGELKRIRIFKEDVVDDIAFKAANKEKDTLAELTEIRLDSRADAKLMGLLETNPEFAKKWTEVKEQQAQAKKAAADRETVRKNLMEASEAKKEKPGSKKAAAAPAPPPPPQPVPQPAPMPMQAYPQAYPGYPPGYAPYPQGQPPMMPMPGMPQYPPQPAMGYPQQPMPQPMPAPLQQPQPAVIQPKAAAVAPKQATPQPKLQPPASKPPVPANTTQRGKAPAAPAKPAAQGAARQVQQPAPATPPATPPAAPAKPAAPGAARQVQQPAPSAPPANDLDFMTDLPDVL